MISGSIVGIIITPLPKVNTPSFDDFRSISILPLLSKVIERIVDK